MPFREVYRLTKIYLGDFFFEKSYMRERYWWWTLDIIVQL
jgi:hypothetical protein